MNPRIGAIRPPPPFFWGSARQGMSWHHIVPYHLLREVWNCLVDQHIATQFPEARAAIRQYLLLCDPTLANREDLIDRIRAENTSQRRAGHHHLQALDSPEVLRLQTAAVWPAWNTIEGPDRVNRRRPRRTSGRPLHTRLDRARGDQDAGSRVAVSAVPEFCQRRPGSRTCKFRWARKNAGQGETLFELRLPDSLPARSVDKRSR